MKVERVDISIPDLLKKGGFEASIILTYSAFLPFYEDVLLRKLQASGCRNNILMMDAGMLSESLSTPSLRPRVAGSEYTLVPMKASGAFHPKIILLIGEKKGMLLVGSHNITISGVSLNREVTTQINIAPTTDKSSVTIAKNVWSFIQSWLNFHEDEIPNQLIDAVNAAKNMAPWLKGHSEDEMGELKFIGSEPSGKTLWEKIQTHIPDPAKRIFVVAPFFDREFKFVKTLHNKTNPKDFIIGIDPSTVEMPSLPKNLNSIRFVDASSLAKRKGYLHAKLIFVEFKSGLGCLITGSANPSRPAWTAKKDKRNAEAVLLHTGKKASAIAKTLGLNKLIDLPEIDSDTWQEIQTRLKDKKSTDSYAKKPIIIAIAEKSGFLLPQFSFSVQDFIKADLIDRNQQVVETINSVERKDKKILIPVESDVQNSIHGLGIHLKNKKSFYAWVHHTYEILRRSESSKQAQFRASMASLETDDPDLINLLQTVESIIFDDPCETDKKVIKSPKQKKPEEEPSKEIESLGVHLKDTKKEKRRKRIINSGDLALILDVLIHNLGLGLERGPEGLDHKGRDEEELVGSDDEDGPDGDVKIDGKTLAQMCNRKVRTIINRMLKQFERRKETGKQYYIPVVQLVAVLALFRQLRKLDIKKTWIPIGMTLLPLKELKRLYSGVLPLLYGVKNSFVEKAKEELVDDLFDEFSRLHGLLLWLAWECGADFRKPKKKKLGCFPEEDRQKNIERAQFLLITPKVFSDPLSFDEAIKSIRQTSINKRISEPWIEVHRHWGEKFARLSKEIPKKLNQLKTHHRAGDIVVVLKKPESPLSVVLSSGQFVSLVDFDKPDGRSEYLPGFVGTIKFPPELNPS